MSLKNLPKGTHFTITINGKTYECIRYKKELDSLSGTTAIIKNPLPGWVPTTNFILGISYYFISNDTPYKLGSILTKEQLIAERIKKLWNTSNWVKNNPHLSY